MMIEVKSSGGVGAGGIPPMMIKKAMIQLGAKSLKSNGGVGGGGGGEIVNRGRLG